MNRLRVEGGGGGGGGGAENHWVMFQIVLNCSIILSRLASCE